ncbi:hypothetical protein [Acidaminococcus sp. DS4831]|uniref:protease inhibitor I42 family protein n=1 Tax=Acidaminococcus sp. DS4831 TaxID=3141399 RepID=UPI0032E37F6C
MKNLDWKRVMVMLSVLALGLPAAAWAEEAFTQTASVSYRSADGTQQEVYSGYGMAVQGSTLTLDLKGNAAGGAGWNVEDLDPAMLRLDSQTVTRLSDTKPQLAVTKLQFTALKPGTTVFQIRQKGNDPTNDLEVHLTIDQAKQISSVHFTRPGASGETDGKTAASLRKSLASVKDPFQETHEGHLIRNGFTGEAYSDDMVLLHLDWGMTQKDVEKLAKKMDCSVQYYMPMLSMAALKLDKPVKNSQEMQQLLSKLDGTTGVIMADVDRVLQLD